ncbi:MAG: GNAT family N-acetyltransferase [Nocardioides sp.]|uniref:GNAT family N-acetyltransferase n=1 Tax=Nocardioides sp. TaxID=35761 RepID=UPI0039E30CAD
MPTGDERPAADLSVRVAWADDAAGIARVQLAVWHADHGLADDPGLTAALPSLEEVAAAWHRSLQAPGDARNRVLVALEQNIVQGFVVCQPSGDPDSDPVADAEISELAVLAEHRHRGHGSRLLQAAADTLHADRFTRATFWLTTDDDALRAFLTGAGWAPDGAHRTLDLDGTGTTLVKQVRLHTALG